ncbi:MAG: hypothetical protein LC725_12625, partial [Lentisphaerae bacterium]|nr:hypothetical protein [Lentisphaerota bacterium]
YFYMPPASSPASPPTVAQVADSLEGVMQAALAPLDSSEPRAANLREQVMELERRLNQARNREVAQLGGEFSRQLRATLEMRRQYEAALADILARDPAGLERPARAGERKKYQADTILANWDNHVAGARPRLVSLLTNLRREKHSALQ